MCFDLCIILTFLSVPQPVPPFYPPYEVVSLMSAPTGIANGTEEPLLRPVVLVGPQGVGRNELKDRLIDSNSSHYGVPVPRKYKQETGVPSLHGLILRF